MTIKRKRGRYVRNPLTGKKKGSYYDGSNRSGIKSVGKIIEDLE